MTRITLISCLLLLGLAPLRAQETQPMDLQKAINYAIENNPSLERSQIAIADANELIIERRAVGIPQLGASVNYQYFIDIPTQILPDFLSPTIYGILFEEGLVEPRPLNTDGGVPAQFGTKHNLTAGLDLNAMVFDGSYFVGLKAARKYRQLVLDQYNSVQYDLKRQVIDAYLPALLIETNLNTLEQNIANLEKLLEETNALYEEGFVEQLDVDRLVLSVDNLRTEYDKLRRQREQAINGLKLVLGYPMDQELPLDDSIPELLATYEVVETDATINPGTRPEYRAAVTGQELNELNIRLNKSLYLPQLYAFGSYQQSLFANQLSEGQWFPTSVVGLNLQIPIFDGLNKKAKVQRAQLDYEETASQLRELEQVIQLEVTNARLAYENARETLDARARNLALAERIYETTKVKYREGVGSSLEINQAEQSLFTSQQNYNQAQYELLRAAISLQRALGRL